MRDTRHEDKKCRYQSHAKDRARDHPAKHAHTNGILRAGASTVRNSQRQHPQPEGKRSHQNRAQAQFDSMQSSFYHVFPCGNQILSKLNDQNSVLRHQPHRCQHANLEVNIVIHAKEQREPQSTDDTARNYQKHGNRH